MTYEEWHEKFKQLITDAAQSKLDKYMVIGCLLGTFVGIGRTSGIPLEQIQETIAELWNKRQ